MNNTHSMVIGYILWIFGFTGAHRFYYGKPITGIIWLCTFGLLGIGWLIDLFLIPGMDAAADRKYSTGKKDYSVAWILLTFGGLLGLHRFYLGKWISGIIFLVVTLFFSFFMMWFLLAFFFAVPFLLLFALPYMAIMIGYDFCTLNGQIDEINRS